MDGQIATRRTVNSLRILLVIESCGGGSARHVLDLARGLLEAGHMVELAYSPLRSDNWFLREMESIPGLVAHPVEMHRDLGLHDLQSVRDLRQLLRECDVCIFPSQWDEPLARAMQEAMACGLVVVGTTTGGSKELLVEGRTGLTFEPEDSDGLARQLCRVVGDPALRARLARAGRRAVVARFGLDRMIDQLEGALRQVVAS